MTHPGRELRPLSTNTVVEPRHCWDDVLGPEERLTSKNYSGKRRVRGNRALLMIDLYNRAFGREPLPLERSIVDHPSSCGLAGWNALPALAELLQAARAAERPVVHTVVNETEGGLGVATLRAVYGEDGQPGNTPSWENRIVEPLAPRAGEVVLGKSRASAFFGTTLSTYFRANGVESLIVAGESTSGCVRASVVDAYSHGFDVVVVEEGVFDRNPLSHKANLFDMHCKYATVVDTATAVALLESDEPATLTVRMA
jgi:nicotinamidase-related amidase